MTAERADTSRREAIHARVARLDSAQRAQLLSALKRRRQRAEQQSDGHPAQSELFQHKQQDIVRSAQLVAYVTCTEVALQSGTEQHRSARLRSALREKLPEYMVPTHLIELPALPLLPNGKLDVHSLPRPGTGSQRPDESTQVDPEDPGTPSTDQLQVAQADVAVLQAANTLCSLLGQLLGTDHIEPGDDFFQVGGDSITAIQFVSRAREAGIPIDVSLLGGQATLHQLAERALRPSRENSDSAVVSHVVPHGEAPLTPIQRWFLSTQQPRPAHWNVAGCIRLPTPANSQRLYRALHQTLLAYPELCSRFTRIDNDWRVEIPTQTEIDKAFASEYSLVHRTSMASMPLANPDARSMPQANSLDTQLNAQLFELGEAFELHIGHMIRFLLVEATDQHSPASPVMEIRWLAHHLVIDDLSSQQMARTIQRYYDHPDLQHPAPQLSMRAWSQTLEQIATQEFGAPPNTFRNPNETDTRSTMVHSSEPPAGDTWTVPELHGNEGNSLTLQSKLPMADLDIFTGTGHDGETRPRSRTALIHLSAALADAIVSLEKAGSLYIETHGRNTLPDVDTSDAIGWLTSFHELPLSDVRRADTERTRPDAVDSYLSLNESRHRLFLMSHYARHSRAPESTTEGVSVLLNYLGERHDFEPSSTRQGVRHWNSQPLISAELRAANNLRAFDIELNAFTSEEHLELRWQYSPSQLGQHQMEQFVAIVLESLKHSESTAASHGHTLSTFPDTNMNQAELDDFLDSLE